MKKISRIALAAVVVVPLFACNSIKETLGPSPSLERELVFTASRESVLLDTKTMRLDDGSVWWGPSEEVSVFYGSGDAGGSKFVSMNSTLAETVELSGSVQMTGAGKDFWAVYPYSTDNSCDGSSVTMTIPASQEGVDGNFSNDVFPTVAKSKTLELAFWNVCGGVKFFVSRNDIKSISFEGNNGETLAGKVKVSFNADGVPEVTKVIDGQTEVVLTAPDGGCFKTGKYYYISLLPGALNSGFTISFRTDTAKGQVISNNSQTIKRSVFGVLKNIDSKVQNWEDALPLPEAVDLGLSVLWATFNVGASAPEEYGNYYAYGETEPKDEYTRENYITPKLLDPYRNQVQTRNVVYSERVLSPECDAAHVALGGEWRMPTMAECKELIEECEWYWTTVNGIGGVLFTSRINGNSIFLPHAGYKANVDNHCYNSIGNAGYYWSSSTLGSPHYLCLDYMIEVTSASFADNFLDRSSYYYLSFGYNYYVYCGLPVRPVQTNPTPRHVNSVTLDKSNLYLYEGREERFDATVLPRTAANKDLVWTSSNPDVAIISSTWFSHDWGVERRGATIQALKAGNTVITVTTVDGNLQATCDVTVMPKQEIEPVDLGLSVKWASMNLGSHGPEEYSDYYHYYQWIYGGKNNKYTGNNAKSSLDAEDDVAHVTLGGNWRMPTIEEWRELVEACTWSWITVHGVSGKTATSNNNGKSIFLPASGLVVRVAVDLAPLEWCGYEGYYWSSTTNIESPSNGKYLRFDSEGEYVDMNYPYYKNESIYLSVRPVYDDRIYPESVSLNESIMSLYVGHSKQLMATVLPENAAVKTVKWSSDKTDVATVDENGNVTAIAIGSATITATTTLGAKTATCTVTVAELPRPEAIDLGLPSGLKWATWNVGASAPEEYGDYFAWGETVPYYEEGYAHSESPAWKTGKANGYHWLSYSWWNCDKGMITRYCPSGLTAFWGGAGAPDGKTEFKDYDYVDDAAHANWGGNWRTPTDAEWKELLENCTSEFTTRNGINGRLVTSNKPGYTDKSIFLPASGFRAGLYLNSVGAIGFYWSSSVYTNDPVSAFRVNFDNFGFSREIYYRFLGYSVRPVSEY